MLSQIRLIQYDEHQKTTRDDHESRRTARSRAGRPANVANMHAPRVQSGPPPPKPSTFDGNQDWRPFYLQFELTAKRYGWSAEVKLDRLIELLRDKALKYFSTLTESDREDYGKLVGKLNNRFGVSILPVTIRRKLQNLKLKDGEKLEELAEHCQ